MQIEWDTDKNKRNIAKHHLSFEVAQQVFNDPLHLSILDRYVDDEARWQTIGDINGAVVVLVAHTVCEETNRIRIISARKATKQERIRYEQAK